MAVANDTPYSYNRRLLTHIQSCLGIGDFTDFIVEDDLALERVGVLIWLLLTYHQCRQNKDGMVLCTQALEYSQKMLGDDHVLTWNILSKKAFLYNELCQ